MEDLTVQFKYEKSTKNTHKFEEAPENGSPPKIGSLYVQKWALPDIPERLEVVVKPIP